MAELSPFLTQVAGELARARAAHAPLNSAHEAYAVLLEELDEFWDEVRKRQATRDRAHMRAELVQIAAMAARAAEDLGLVAPAPPSEPDVLVEREWRVLHLLAAYRDAGGGPIMAEIISMSGLNERRAHRAMDRLRRLGYIQTTGTPRTPSRRYQLTPAGQQLMSAILQGDSL